MKGLRLFIEDLRRCENKQDQELKRINLELAKIRSKLNAGKQLNGYQKKKYVSKLIFAFLLGYECDLGYLLAVNLLSSNVYSEKRIGYLFISVVMNDNSIYMQMIVNSVKHDLSSNKSIFQNLALQFVANSTSIHLADSTADLVKRLLFFSGVEDFVTQTAALTLLQLLRIKSDLILDEFQIVNVINLLFNTHLGIVTASAGILEFLAKNYPSKCQFCVEPCIVRLSTIITISCIDYKDYYYYSISLPWITVKLLRILQNFPLPSNISLKSRLWTVLQVILNSAQNPVTTKGFYQNNAKFSIIFEAISLIIQMEIEGLIISRSIFILKDTLQHKEVNRRYLALDLMTQLASDSTYRKDVKLEWSTILSVLKSESDVVVKKRAIDLLYLICDENNAKPVVKEMLRFLDAEQDYADEVVLKTATLAEKFSIDQQWYFDIMLYIFQICGETMNNNTWYSVAKMVFDNNHIQEYAAKASYAVLFEKNCPDILIKMAGYILGEFGYMIAENPESNFSMQLQVLKNVYPSCCVPTKAFLLTTFMKFLSIHPKLKNEVQSILRDKSIIQNKSEEIQQRAVEYLKLSEVASEGFLASVLGDVPLSTQKKLATLQTVEKEYLEKSLIEFTPQNLEETNPSTSGSYCNFSQVYQTVNRNPFSLSRSFSYSNFQDMNSSSNIASSNNANEVMACMTKSTSNLQDIDSSNNLKLLMNIFQEKPISDVESESSSISSHLVLNNQLFLENALFKEKAALYEDKVIRVLFEREFNRNIGRFHLKIFNKTPYELFEFSIQGSVFNTSKEYRMPFRSKNFIMSAYALIEDDIHIVCLKEFVVKPSLNLRFILQGQCHEIELILPLTLNNFVKPYPMTIESFFELWWNFDPNTEVVKEFEAKHPMSREVILQKLNDFRMSVVESVKFQTRFHCAGIFHTTEDSLVFLIIVVLYDSKYYYSNVRSSKYSLSQVISGLLSELF